MSICRINNCNNNSHYLVPFCQNHLDLVDTKIANNLIGCACLYDESQKGLTTEAQTVIIKKDTKQAMIVFLDALEIKLK